MVRILGELEAIGGIPSPLDEMSYINSVASRD